jgi:hypothetical protein
MSLIGTEVEHDGGFNKNGWVAIVREKMKRFIN